MIPIPGFIIATLTFPGVIVHELAHQLFCRWMRVAVLEVCYFRVGNPSGYVVHEPPRHALQSLMIGIGPFFVNTILAAIIGFPAALSVHYGSPNVLDFVLLYLAISIGMHAFPSTGDAKSIWSAVTAPDVPAYVKVLATPIVGFIYLGALGSFFWLDALYGGLVALGLPLLLARALSGG